MSGQQGGDRRLLSTAETAGYLGVPVRSLQANWKRWELKPYRVGKRLQYRVSDLESWLESRQEAAA